MLSVRIGGARFELSTPSAWLIVLLAMASLATTISLIYLAQSL